MNIDGCQQICTNIRGSFICSCIPGYQLHDNMTTCVGKFLNIYAKNVVHRKDGLRTDLSVE